MTTAGDAPPVPPRDIAVLARKARIEGCSTLLRTGLACTCGFACDITTHSLAYKATSLLRLPSKLLFNRFEERGRRATSQRKNEGC